MATVLDIVKGALRDLNVLAAGEEPAFNDANDALTALNQLLDQWKAEKLRIYQHTRTTWTITSGTGQYTFGSGGDVSSRPLIVDDVRFVETNTSPNSEYPLSKLTEQAYRGITQKSQTATWPQAWYYNPVYPLATLDFWPVPTSTTLTGVIYWPQPVGTFAALTTSVSVQPGYERMMQKALAMELAPSYGMSVLGTDLESQAVNAKEIVKRNNKRLIDMQFDRGVLIGTARRLYNIYEG